MIFVMPTIIQDSSQFMKKKNKHTSSETAPKKKAPKVAETPFMATLTRLKNELQEEAGSATVTPTGSLIPPEIRNKSNNYVVPEPKAAPPSAVPLKTKPEKNPPKKADPDDDERAWLEYTSGFSTGEMLARKFSNEAPPTAKSKKSLPQITPAEVHLTPPGDDWTTAAAEPDLYAFIDEGSILPGRNLEIDPLLPQSKKKRRQILKGEFEIDAELDLHHLRTADVLARLARFIRESRQQQAGMVRIVTGRGRNSKDGVSVIRNMVINWLRAVQGREIREFYVAPQRYGGEGAFLIELVRSEDDD
jgi:DNA-nicking Smr family endonuclease